MNGVAVAGILANVVVAATPLWYASLGETVAELSGVMNLGIEGMMLVGAVVAYAVVLRTGSMAAASLAALAAGALMALLHAGLTVSLRRDQIVSGLALTLMGTGLSAFLGRGYTDTAAVHLSVVPIPLLDRIPYVGPAFFDQSWLIYVSYALLPLCLWIGWRTRAGLYLRAAGENPAALDAEGVSVAWVRYVAVGAGGALAGIAGAIFTLIYIGSWTQDITAGNGWIAFALVVFAGWNPVRAFLGSYLFGLADVLAFQSQLLGHVTAWVPVEFMQMLPYLLTIAALAVTRSPAARRRMRGPAALGAPFERGAAG